jgi:hypothetical protein
MASLLTKIVTRIIQISQSIRRKFSVTEKSKKATSSLEDPFRATAVRFSDALSSPVLDKSPDDKNKPLIQKYAFSIFEEKLRKLRLATHRGQKLKYKPLLLLAICRQIDSGEIKENKIFLTPHLEQCYIQLADSIGYRNSINIGLPFYHLRTSGFWCHKIFPDKEHAYADDTSLGQNRSRLNEIIEYASIPSPYSKYFFKGESRHKIKQILMETYFSETDRNSILTIFGNQSKLKISEPIFENQPEPERNEIVQQSSVEHDLVTPKTDQPHFQLPDTPDLIKKQIETNQAHPSSAENLGRLSMQELNRQEQELTQGTSQPAEYLSPKDKSVLVPEQHQEKIDQQHNVDSHLISEIENGVSKIFSDQSDLELPEPISKHEAQSEGSEIIQQSFIENDLATPKTAQPKSHLPDTPALLKEQIEINHPHHNSNENEDLERPAMHETGRMVQETNQISPRSAINLPSKAKVLSAPKQHRKKKRQLFYFDFQPIPESDTQILTEFLERGEQGTLKDMVGINPQKIEEFLLNAFNRYDFIGEIPFSKPTFDFFRQIIQQNYIVGKKPKVKKVPPAIYITSMVFCARYSEEDARKFWQPYAELVWQTDLSQYFQKVCRDHYVQSRDFLLDHFELDFPALRPGEVVRPIYYQAVIPFYLQSTFAQWLISNFEQVLKFSTEDLPPVLQSDNSLDYEPKGFKNFVTGSDTRDAAAKLITQMAKAIKLFQATEQFEAVNSIMDSPIERSLWREVYEDLIQGNLELEKVRSYAAKLEWVWNMEKMDLGLQLSHVRSQKREKPNLIVWASKDNQDLITEEHIFDVHPWQLEDDDWELETEIIYEFGELDGKVFVLSEGYDLEEPTVNQGSNIILEKEIPVVPEAPLLFFIPSIGTIARSKDKINVNGNWIVLSKDEFEIQGHKDICLITSEIHIPVLLRKAGYRYAKQYRLELPVEFLDASGIIEFKQPSSAYIFEATLEGEKPVLEFSPRIQPIFTSNQIRIRALANFPTINFQRIWISIYRANVFSQSISLEDFQQQSLLAIEDNQYSINLSPYIKEPGLYTIAILHNLQDLLETPLKFGYMPALNIVGPEPSKCYSPENPATIQISGIPENHIVLPEGEKVKFQISTTGLQLIVREMRLPEARFLLQWDGNNIQICYDIERVTAWVEGRGDKGNVMEHQTAEVMLHIRGNPNERYSWVVNGSQFRSDYYLNAKGEFNEALEKTVLRDILRKSKFIDTEIGIIIRGQTWRLFTFTKFPKIIIEEVTYQNSNIVISLKQETPLAGSYELQVKSAINPMERYVIARESVLQMEHTIVRQLEPGMYILEIVSRDEIIARSTSFTVSPEKKDTPLSSPKKILIPLSREFNALEIYESLSATPSVFLALRNQKSEPLLPILEQLKTINNKNTWVKRGGELDESFEMLLPSWAVISHPLRIITKQPRKVLHIFPQKVLYGGKYGKGYMQAKIADGSIKFYAAWKTNLEINQTKLWLMVPQEENITRFCDLDEFNLWPCYRCITCGTIVGSKDGNRLKLAPKTISLHTHESRKPINEQFIDVVYEQNMQASISQYEGELLHQSDTPNTVIDNKYINNFLEGKQQGETGEMGRPISPESAKAYKIAISEMVSNYSEKIHEFNLKQLLGKHELWKKLEFEFSALNSKVSAFNAFFRLYQCLNVPNAFAAIPKHTLLLAMLLRYKGHHPKDYKFILDNAGTDERTVVKLTHLAMTSCPKLMEWSIFWAEIFFHHTAS